MKAPRVAPARRDAISGLGHKGRVLVAEDNDDVRALLTQILQADGHVVVEVASGRELLDVLAERTAKSWPQEAFDVIVTDHQMPHGDGLDTIAQLRRAGCATPILLITSFADESLRDRAEALETMVMCKPFPLPAFRTAIGVLLSLHAAA
jgi:CheY-like chemotaxis protein